MRRGRWIGVSLAGLVVLAVVLGAVATGDEKAGPKRKRGRRKKPKPVPVVYEPAVQQRLDYLFGQRRAGHLVDRIRELATRGEPADRDALIVVATNRRSPRHQEAALDALGRIGDAASVDYLCSKQALGQRNPRGQVFSAVALGQARDERAIPALVGSLRKKRQRPEMIHACLVALARIAPNRESIEARLLDYAKRPWSRVRSGAMDALGWAATPEATSRLVQALADDASAQVRTSAARALARTRRPEAKPALEKASKSDSSSAVRAAATRSLALLGD